MSRLLALGVPGVFVAWVVTPVVLISTYIFGQKILKIKSKSLNMVISADMSVCGVSAAIATAAACKAKKEELSLAIGISLAFTAVMMVVLPMIISATGMDEILAGAWMGGTIDATGAVAAAGALVGDQALEVAATVKMIQNILIGVTAFGVAIYWVTSVERDPEGARPNAMEIWYRFPKFVIGFVLASVTFSLIHGMMAGGPEMVGAMIQGLDKNLGQVAVRPGVRQYRAGNEFPRTHASTQRRKAAAVVPGGTIAEPLPDLVHGLADVRRRV